MNSIKFKSIFKLNKRLFLKKRSELVNLINKKCVQLILIEMCAKIILFSLFLFLKSSFECVLIEIDTIYILNIHNNYNDNRVIYIVFLSSSSSSSTTTTTSVIINFVFFYDQLFYSL